MIASLLLAMLAALIPQSAARLAAAPSATPVWYDSLNNIIYVGRDYNPGDPAESPYVGYPSHPQAPKTPITIPQVAAALNKPDLLQDQGGGAWLLKANMVISATARLEATKATISWLRLDSTPGAKFPALTSVTANGGHLLIQDIKVTSWAGSDVDTNYFDGRSYLLAKSGGRMDVIRSEVAYLGWSAGEPSGLAWRLRAGYGGDDPVTANNIKVGATGSILNSNIHNNYFGQYSFQAYGLRVFNNEFHDNAFYGFDPHDYSTGFEVAYNQIYNNGTHGISFDAGSTKNLVYGNTNAGNGVDGVTVKGPADPAQVVDSRNKITRNSIMANGRKGIKVDATANRGIQPPTITSAPGASVVTGTAAPNALVEIYRDRNGQGQVFKGAATASAAGSWSFTLPDNNTNEGGVTALANNYDTDITNGRSYILAKYDAHLDVKNADLSYLGSGDGESYGVSWRDINDGEAPTVLRTRVTGQVLNSNFSYNYYGIYLIGGSDGNTIDGNTITGSGKHGIYFKTGKNTISNNTVTGNGTVVNGAPVGSGIASYQDGDTAAAIADLQPPGSSISIAAADPDLASSPVPASVVEGNVITKNTVAQNIDEGIELKSASGTKVESNVVYGNGSNGIYLASGASKSMITLNTISGNKGYGIRANGFEVVDNQWTKNLVFDNATGGITITSGANNGVPAPKIDQQGRTVTVTTQADMWVELYSDDGGQGRFFEARIKADTGTITLTRAWKGSMVNATATDTEGNTSGFAFNRGSSVVYIPLISRKVRA